MTVRFDLLNGKLSQLSLSLSHFLDWLAVIREVCQELFDVRQSSPRSFGEQAMHLRQHRECLGLTHNIIPPHCQRVSQDIMFVIVWIIFGKQILRDMPGQGLVRRGPEVLATSFASHPWSRMSNIRALLREASAVVWCPHSQILSPILHKSSVAHSDEVKDGSVAALGSVL